MDTKKKEGACNERIQQKTTVCGLYDCDRINTWIFDLRCPEWNARKRNVCCNDRQWDRHFIFFRSPDIQFRQLWDFTGNLDRTMPDDIRSQLDMTQIVTTVLNTTDN